MNLKESEMWEFNEEVGSHGIDHTGLIIWVQYFFFALMMTSWMTRGSMVSAWTCSS